MTDREYRLYWTTVVAPFATRADYDNDVVAWIEDSERELREAGWI